MKIQYVNRTSGANAACTNDDTGEASPLLQLLLCPISMLRGASPGAGLALRLHLSLRALR